MKIQEIYPKLVKVKDILADINKCSQMIGSMFLDDKGIYFNIRYPDGIAYGIKNYFTTYENFENWNPEQIAEGYINHEKKCQEELDSKKCKTCGHIKRDLIW